jgi:hypothetical protein
LTLCRRCFWMPMQCLLGGFTYADFDLMAHTNGIPLSMLTCARTSRQPEFDVVSSKSQSAPPTILTSIGPLEKLGVDVKVLSGRAATKR